MSQCHMIPLLCVCVCVCEGRGDAEDGIWYVMFYLSTCHVVWQACM